MMKDGNINRNLLSEYDIWAPKVILSINIDDRKEFVANLNYTAQGENFADIISAEISEKCVKNPHAIKFWKINLDTILPIFKFSPMSFKQPMRLKVSIRLIVS